MLKVTDKEILAPTGFEECWFYGYRVDDRKKLDGLVRIFCQDIITGMEIGDRCVFFIKARNYVKLLKSELWGWELEILSAEDSKAFLELEWLTTL